MIVTAGVALRRAGQRGGRDVRRATTSASRSPTRACATSSTSSRTTRRCAGDDGVRRRGEQLLVRRRPDGARASCGSMPTGRARFACRWRSTRTAATTARASKRRSPTPSSREVSGNTIGARDLRAVPARGADRRLRLQPGRRVDVTVRALDYSGAPQAQRAGARWCSSASTYRTGYYSAARWSRSVAETTRRTDADGRARRRVRRCRNAVRHLPLRVHGAATSDRTVTGRRVAVGPGRASEATDRRATGISS